jgi:hypothetical protein
VPFAGWSVAVGKNCRRGPPASYALLISTTFDAASLWPVIDQTWSAHACSAHLLFHAGGVAVVGFGHARFSSTTLPSPMTGTNPTISFTRRSHADSAASLAPSFCPCV